MILIIDNYDSFTYNLFQLVGTIDASVRVVRNDAIDVAGIRALAPDRLILSPGPGRPEDAGVCMAAAREFAGKLPVLGVCLGHQAICTALGATVGPASHLMHGKRSRTSVDQTSALFLGLPAEIEVGRYHSLSVDPATLPDCLRVTATADDGEVMAVEHASGQLFGVQFHPESILTPDGARILENFCRLRRVSPQAKGTKK